MPPKLFVRFRKPHGVAVAVLKTGGEMASNERTILITGSTDGVGRRVAERLARAGTTILIHGRNAERGTEIVASIRRAGGAATFYAADLSSLAEVRRLAKTIVNEHQRLDVLVNNAGIGVGRPGDGRRLSRDGHELRFAVNYLSGFLLTHLVLPLLAARTGSRIVNVSSVGQQKIDFADVMLTRGYDGRRAYCQSKLAQVMFTFDLAEELKNKGVTANCLHPATYMDTTMVRLDGFQPMSSVDEGADAILRLVQSPDLDGKTGLYVDGTRNSRANDQAYDAQARARLRALSCELVGLSTPADLVS
jgi:NAD(P)-dependent dehydrogenase (short-subunit alcohol dehydrogenase family)